MIYFDNASTTFVHEEVLESMLPFLRKEYGNPNSKYYPLAENAKAAVNNARINIAKIFNIKHDEVIFTSSGSESNNMIIKGIAFKHNPLHMITTKIEHSSVMDTMEYLETLGWRITYIEPTSEGKITLEALENSITRDTKLITIGWVNSEIGTIQNIKELSDLSAKHKVPFHTDATQAVGKVDIDLEKCENVNFMSLSSHKLNGPKGSAAAIIRRDKDGVPYKIVPLIHGGEQEFGLRAGTSPVANIVGFSKAVSISTKNIKKKIENLNKLENFLIDKLKLNLRHQILINNETFDKVPGILSIQFKGFNNQLLLKNAANIFAASTGSACSNSKPSRVLKAIGLSDNEIRQSIRISLSEYNTKEEIDAFINALT